jgi:hypothetical protein
VPCGNIEREANRMEKVIRRFPRKHPYRFPRRWPYRFPRKAKQEAKPARKK